MKIHFGEYEFNLQRCEKITTGFPLTFTNKTIMTVVSLEPVGEQDLLSHYACGDTMGNLGQHIASTQCSNPPIHKITLSVQLQRKEGTPEMAQCTAVGCLEHSFVILLQTLFLTGLMTGLTVEASQDGSEENI